MHKLFISFFIGLIVSSGLRAQPNVTEDELVSVEFVIYSWKCTLPELSFTGNQKIEAMLDPFSLSPVQSYTGAPELSFYSGNVNPDAIEGKPPTPLARVTFSGESSKYIILAARSSGGRYQMMAIPVEDSDSTKPYLRVRNFTQYDLAIKYDDKDVITLAPSAISKIELEGTATVLRVARLENGRWLRSFNNVAELNDLGPKDIVFASEDNRPVAMFNIPKWPGRKQSNQETVVQSQ